MGDSRSLDAESCKFWFRRVYSDLSFGFWNTLFMQLRSVSTSGSSSTHVQAFYQLSANIQIFRSNDAEGNHKIEVRASTRAALRAAVSSLSLCFFLHLLVALRLRSLRFHPPPFVLRRGLSNTN